MEQQVPGGREQRVPQGCFEGEETDGGQKQDAGDGTEVRDEVEGRDQNSPKRSVGNTGKVEASADQYSEADVDYGDREKIVGDALLNFVTDLNGVFLVAQCRHHPHELLQKQIARSEQE